MSMFNDILRGFRYATDYEKTLAALHYKGYTEGDEMNPKEYRLDREEDGKLAIILRSSKRWYSPTGRYLREDQF